MNNGPAPYRILVVDDDPSLREVVCELLAEEGYSVSSAANGEEALRHLDVGPVPDFVLTDLRMPRLDGWELCDQIAASTALARVPIAVMSSHLGDDQGVPPRAVAYLRKPFEADQLLQMLECSLLAAPRKRCSA